MQIHVGAYNSLITVASYFCFLKEFAAPLTSAFVMGTLSFCLDITSGVLTFLVLPDPLLAPGEGACTFQGIDDSIGMTCRGNIESNAQSRGAKLENNRKLCWSRTKLQICENDLF